MTFNFYFLIYTSRFSKNVLFFRTKKKFFLSCKNRDDHGVVYSIVASLYCLPETNRMLTSILKKMKEQDYKSQGRLPHIIRCPSFDWHQDN